MVGRNEEVIDHCLIVWYNVDWLVAVITIDDLASSGQLPVPRWLPNGELGRTKEYSDLCQLQLQFAPRCSGTPTPP